MINDKAVEAAAKVIRRESFSIESDPADYWSDCGQSERGQWRNAASAALEAALPHLIDVDELAEVIRASQANDQGLKIRDDLRTARAVAEYLGRVK